MTTGSGSSFNLTRLAAKYNQMRTDGRILSNRQSIEIIRARIQQLLGRLGTKDVPDRVKKLIKMWGQYKSLRESRRDAEANVLMRDIDMEFERAYLDSETWEQLLMTLDLDRKMVESEIKVLKEIKAIMTAEDAYELTAKLMAAVIKVVGDSPKKIKEVQYEFTRIIGESSDRVRETVGNDDGGDGGEDGDIVGSGEVDREELLYPGDQEPSETARQD